MITKERAIFILKYYKARLEESVYPSFEAENIQALEMAISALESRNISETIVETEIREENNEPYFKKPDDLISRQEVLDSLNYYEIENEIDNIDFGYNHAIQTIRSDVMEMKTYSAKEDTAESNGDLISRKAVIQLTREMISAEEYDLLDLLDEVKKLPTYSAKEDTAENLHRENEQEYYRGFEDSRKMLIDKIKEVLK